jgi:hypothetical protein
MQYLQHMHKIKLRRVIHLLVALAFGFVLMSCTTENISPTSTDVAILNPITTTTTTLEFQDPSVPYIGGRGLPASDTPIDEEIDCENAENLCEEGRYACDDIADYCDYGPDGGELPDEFDWDR